jgi:2-polyprenyl-3-methyl-5-hydroxy-6-metoxy-1,4-benzoquinol methylase
MSARTARGLAPVPTGNTFDKYGSRNPVVRRLMVGFESSLDDLFARAEPGSLLDVGCGEGVLTLRWAEAMGERPVVGLDLEDPKLKAEWGRRLRPNLRFVSGQGEQLPFAEHEFDLVAAIETLEHVVHPERTLAEMRRVTRRHLLVSVPREPLWRALNLARGAYIAQLGNTPGHVNHWSRGGFGRLLSRYGDVVELRTPFPWTMALVRIH